MADHVKVAELLKRAGAYWGPILGDDDARLAMKPEVTLINDMAEALRQIDGELRYGLDPNRAVQSTEQWKQQNEGPKIRDVLNDCRPHRWMRNSFERGDGTTVTSGWKCSRCGQTCEAMVESDERATSLRIEAMNLACSPAFAGNFDPLTNAAKILCFLSGTTVEQAEGGRHVDREEIALVILRAPEKSDGGVCYSADGYARLAADELLERFDVRAK